MPSVWASHTSGIGPVDAQGRTRVPAAPEQRPKQGKLQNGNTLIIISENTGAVVLNVTYVWKKRVGR